MEIEEQQESIETTDTTTEETSEQTSETVDTETEEQTETEQSEVEEEQESSDEELSEETEVEEETEELQAYKPNTKIKVLEKELEIPEKFHNLMVDEKSEKEVRELFEKAHGIDFVKQKLTDTRTERDEYAQENELLRGGVQQLRNVYQKATSPGGNIHDLDLFFERLKIPLDVVMKYTVEKAKLMELPQDQRQAFEQNLYNQREAERANQARIASENQSMGMVQRVRAMEVEQALYREENRNIAASFDEKFGKPGLFKQAVYQVGQLAWQQEGVDLSVDEAIDRVAKFYNLNAGTMSAVNVNENTSNSSNPQSQKAGGKPVVKRAAPNTIPNISGRSSSPLKNKPRSIEDLKQISKEKYG